MFAKLKRFLCFVDDLAEVLVFHVLFSRANWKKTTVALLVAALAFSRMAHKAPVPHAKPVYTPPAITVTAADHAARGYDALVKGRLDEAIRYLEMAVAGAPANALYAQRLGLAYLEAGRHTQAQWTLEGAFRLSPSRTTLFYLGCVYQNMKLPDVAIGYFNQVKAPANAGATLTEGPSGFEAAAEAKIGECYIKKGEYDRAIEVLTRTTLLYPNYPHAYFYLGVAHWEKGDPDLGVEQFFRVIELYPQESAAYYNVACYYSIKGIPDLALVWLEKALKAGFHDFRHMASDHDLDNIRTLPAYTALLAKHQKSRN